MRLPAKNTGLHGPIVTVSCSFLLSRKFSVSKFCLLKRHYEIRPRWLSHRDVCSNPCHDIFVLEQDALLFFLLTGKNGKYAKVKPDSLRGRKGAQWQAEAAYSTGS